MIAAVVLAAGRSARLGRPKQLLDLDGRPVLQHVVDAVAAAAVDETVIVLGHAADDVQAVLDLPAGARIVMNPGFGSGQASSLRAGLDALGRDVDAAAIVMGDQPRITPQLIDRVINAWRARGEPVVRPLFRGVPGHPVIAGRAAWDAFRSAAGDEGARGVMGQAEVVEVELDLDPLVDIDTWKDYERLRRAD